MKMISLLFAAFFMVNILHAQTLPIHKADSSKKILLVDAACGECQFKLAGSSCDLAVKIDGKAYFVDGTKIDDHGDAHATDGFCNAVRKAEVQGEIKDNRFVATYFKLVSAPAAKEHHPNHR